MRVIAGSAKSLKLKTIAGMDTRPTTDRIKETLFNMINPLLYHAVFLDLFSGSGGIGIEALSRGAKSCVFVEQNKAAIGCIKDNLAFTRLQDRSRIIQDDVLHALKRLESSVVFDIVFMDPPYDREYEKEVLHYLTYSNIIHEKTQIIIEASGHTDFSYVGELNFQMEKQKEYKTNKHVFLRKKM